MLRHNPTERLGVIAADYAITSHLNWIFREQPIADVGIDAIIEECIDSDPTGYFLAAQIKSGESNFYITDNAFFYYISNVHYNYWLNLNIPIILIAHLPKYNLICWQKIDKTTIIKTKSQWKLKIPKTNLIDKKSKELLTKYLRSFQKLNIKDIFNSITDKDSILSASLFLESTKSISNINSLLNNIGEQSRKFSQENHSKSITPLEQQCKSFYLIAQRLDHEVLIFSKVFADETLLLEKQLFIFKSSDPESTSLNFKDRLQQTINITNANIAAFQTSVEIIKGFPKKPLYMKSLREKLVETHELLITEHEAARSLLTPIVESI